MSLVHETVCSLLTLEILRHAFPFPSHVSLEFFVTLSHFLTFFIDANV
jgi:hypothetical protein